MTLSPQQVWRNAIQYTQSASEKTAIPEAAKLVLWWNGIGGGSRQVEHQDTVLHPVCLMLRS